MVCTRAVHLTTGVYWKHRGYLPEWFRRWQEITEPGGINGFWRLAE